MQMAINQYRSRTDRKLSSRHEDEKSRTKEHRRTEGANTKKTQLKIARRKHGAKFEESQMTVPCPQWVRRKMLHNLDVAAKSKINPDSSKRASVLLEKIKTESLPTVSKPDAQPEQPDRTVSTNQVAETITKTVPSRIWQLASVALKKCVKKISTSVTGARVFRVSHS
jgi:hypothetical protein